MNDSNSPPSPIALWLGGGILLWLLYSAVFAITAGTKDPVVLVDALANVLPLILLAAVTHQILGKLLRTGSVKRQALVHLISAPMFALVWYSLVAVLLGFVKGFRGNDFAPEAFSNQAATWQTFQGLILYALVVAICYAIRGGREAAQVTIVSDAGRPLVRYLVRDEEGLRPLETSDIVTITGAQDYSEVSTNVGKHLVRMSLSEFERMLDASQFVRVHRSAIISLRHLEVAESAGSGRMLARMLDGAEIPVSRSGASKLREFVA